MKLSAINSLGEEQVGDTGLPTVVILTNREARTPEVETERLIFPEDGAIFKKAIVEDAILPFFE